MIRILLLLSVCLTIAQAYPMYQDVIPNGHHVPHPCLPNYLWHGVGHKVSQGGGDRNPFGLDFATNGHEWNEALCRKDSDGDGRTNGEELGDPQCVWKKGDVPASTKNITHPGVCDPYDEVSSCVAKNSWLDCSRDVEFNCPHIHDPDVVNITLRFPRTKVPAKETTYICFNFHLPDDQAYHLIATQPFIDNHNVMHHMALTTCDDTVGLIDEPQECLMGTEGCSEVVGIWSLGQTGECIPPEAGYLVGKGHTTMITIQHHWTNPQEIDHWYDSSGMILYLTPKLRRYNAAVLTLGQMHLEIPPGRASYVEHGACGSECTNKFFMGDVQVFSVLNHMHYLGTRQNVTLARPGNPLQVVADDNPYRYDTPKLHLKDPPLTLYAGDKLETHCTYQSLSRSKTTFYGEGSYEEMCFSFLSFYPAENVTSSRSCIQWKDTNFCNMREQCDQDIYNIHHPATAAMVKKVLDHCDPRGSCRPECPAIVQEVREESNCIKNMWGYVSHLIVDMAFDATLMKFVWAMDSCSQENQITGGHTTLPPAAVTTAKPSETQTTMAVGPGAMFLNLVKAIDSRPLLQNIIMNINNNRNYGVDYNNAHDHDDTWH